MDAPIEATQPRETAGRTDIAPAATTGISHWERLLVAGLALAVMQVFFYEYLLSARPVHLWSDADGYHFPLQRYAFQSLKDGRLPLWDPSIYCGTTFAGNVQAAFFYPPTWLLFAAQWRHSTLSFRAYEEFIFLHVWIGFVLCYLWLRARTGLLASVLGAGVFACGGYLVYMVLHPGMVGAMAWMPLAFWGVDEARQRADWRPLWKVAASTALAFLAGYPAAWLVNCIVVPVYALAGGGRWKSALGACLAIAASVPLFLMQLLPSLDARGLMQLEGKYGPGAYGWKTLLESYFLPNWFNFNPGHPVDYEPGCIYLYLGLPALFAIGCAIRRHRLRPYLPAVAAIAVALFLANPPTWFWHAIEHVPPINQTLQPFNFYAGIAPMAALITALSLDNFLARRGKRAAPLWLAMAAAAGVSVWALRELAICIQDGHFASHWDSVGQTAIAAVLFAVCLWCVRDSTGWRRIVLISALLFSVAMDYKVYGTARWFSALPGDPDEGILPYGIGGLDDEGYRAMVANRQFRNVAAHEEGIAPLQYRLYGLATPEGFDPFLTTRYRQRIESWTPFLTNRMFDFDVRSDDMLQTLAVRYVTARQDSPDDQWIAHSGKFRLIGRWHVFCHVWEYLAAKPPYRWDGAARPVAWRPERREFDVESAAGGQFALVEQYFPGWRATVDGRRVEVAPWNGAFQEISVPPGKHRVTFRFLPASVEIGAALSALAWMGLAMVAWSNRQRKRLAGAA